MPDDNALPRPKHKENRDHVYDSIIMNEVAKLPRTIRIWSNSLNIFFYTRQCLYSVRKMPRRTWLWVYDWASRGWIFMKANQCKAARATLATKPHGEQKREHFAHELYIWTCSRTRTDSPTSVCIRGTDHEEILTEEKNRRNKEAKIVTFKIG